MSDGETGEDGYWRRMLDAMGFQLSMQFWVGVLSGLIFGFAALVVWLIK